MKMKPLFRLLGLLSVVALAASTHAVTVMEGEKPGIPALGTDLTRNPVNLTDKNAPTEWTVEAGKAKNIKWVQDIGMRGYVSPVVAGGRVFVSTNNGNPRDKKIKDARAILMCFAEKDGTFLWQAVHDMAPLPVDQQADKDGLVSMPTVEGNHVYYVTPGCVVVCADVKTGKAVWTYDLMRELKVFPCIINACSPLVVGDYVYVVTGNGLDDNGVLVAPKAPSFVALAKKTGKLKWQSALPGDKIIFSQWSSPAYAEVGGKGQVIFPGGDNYVYSLDPLTGDMIWKFRVAPLKGTKQEQKKPNYIVATPVVHGQRVYVSLGASHDTGTGNNVGHLWCIDITKKGDVSPQDDNFDPKAAVNKNSALVWHFGGVADKGERTIIFGPTLSRVAVHDGLVYAVEEAGYFYCLDGATGKKLWEHDLKNSVWSSPYWADGKVYLPSEDGGVRIFQHGRQKKLLPEEPDMDGQVQSTPVMANGVMYIATKSKLYAIAGK